MNYSQRNKYVALIVLISVIIFHIFFFNVFKNIWTNILIHSLLVSILLYSLMQLKNYWMNKQNIDELLLSKEISEKIIEENPCMIFVKDWNGYYLLANSTFADMFGVTPKDIIGKLEKDFNPLATNIEKRLKEDQDIMNGTKDKVVFEVPFQHSSGETKWIHAIKTPITHKGKKYVLCVSTDITDRKRNEELVHKQAYFDDLTGLPNRLNFYDALAAHLEKSKETNGDFSLFFIDLDRFKLVNDTLGHTMGDKLLQKVSIRLSECIDSIGEVYRLSGDEFTIILPTAAYEHVKTVAEKIINELTRPIFIKDHEFIVTASIGISLYPVDGSDVETLFKRADTAMYIAKEHGKNTYSFYQPEHIRTTSDRFMLEYQLRKAVEKNEFSIYFQPKMNIKTGKITGVEALIRWQHPELDMISPADFIPIAEETGLIVSIGEWVLEEACRLNKAWQEAGYPSLVVSVNLSPVQFRHDVIGTVNRVLEKTGLEGKWLELEITENTLMRNEESVIKILKTLRERGIKISIDDFGTGYCTLSYLKHLPLDTLKIARPFIRDLHRDLVDAAIATTLIELGHSINLNVIAEGVEEESQLHILNEHKCDEIQGYLVSQPKSELELLHWIEENLDDDGKLKERFNLELSYRHK
ncbi:EAL domain-containing protein [Bacillus salitolerans]|uniref:EAL domain-containing protein n=1 Tax=Bacillus salitolerans TaxID=1437434 RepID=A0ABW4LZJ6_9BACI